MIALLVVLGSILLHAFRALALEIKYSDTIDPWVMSSGRYIEFNVIEVILSILCVSSYGVITL
jgi:hypothetical protein